MTALAARNLKKGQEVFNTITGEVAYFSAAVGTVGVTVYIESVGKYGKTQIWSHKQTESL